MYIYRHQILTEFSKFFHQHILRNITIKWLLNTTTP